MKQLRLALIGGGRWATMHRNAIRATQHQLALVCVHSEASRARLERAWEIPTTTQLADVTASDVDAVIVASPNDQHVQHSIACLQHGKHVLVEKPMALTLADCHAMQQAASQAGRVLMPGMQMRLFGHVQRLQSLLPQLGPLRWLNMSLWREPHPEGTGTWRQNDHRRGSLWLEEPIHYLDLAAALMGAPATALQAWAPAPDVLQARLVAHNGATAHLDYALRGAGHSLTLQAVGDTAAAELTWRGTFDIDPLPQVRLTRYQGGVAQALDVSQQCGHLHDGSRVLQAFADACNGSPWDSCATMADGSRAVAGALAAASSVARGEAVALEQSAEGY